METKINLIFKKKEVFLKNIKNLKNKEVKMKIRVKNLKKIVLMDSKQKLDNQEIK